MSKGIIYIMTTAVSGLIKIGKTGSANFEQRMYNLEHDGSAHSLNPKKASASLRSGKPNAQKDSLKKSIRKNDFCRRSNSAAKNTKLFNLRLNNTCLGGYCFLSMHGL